MYIYGAPSRKKTKPFCAQNIFLMQQHLVFVNMKHFFVQRFVDTRLLFVQRQTFCFNPKLLLLCNTKFFFWTLFRMLCHGDIFLLSHSNKNIITRQKINKISFLCDTKRLISFFCASQILYIQILHYTLAAC